MGSYPLLKEARKEAMNLGRIEIADCIDWAVVKLASLEAENRRLGHVEEKLQASRHLAGKNGKRVVVLESQLAEAKTDLRNALALLRYCFDGDDIPVIYTVEELREWVKGDSGQGAIAAARGGEKDG